jgi:type III secretion protein V
VKSPFRFVALVLFVAGLVALLVLPLPTPLLDVLITLNLALSMTLLLGALSIRSALELSTLPTLLVLSTLFRLGLNVSSVRLVLSQADAGRVIHAFGAFVVRGDYIVGAAVFLLITLVQFLVIARGAERVAEVAARFNLDALPGRQLAIDGDLRAGAITQKEAETRRARLGEEAQLFGALDGAMRFIKGDAVASLVILGLSIAGGLLIGVLRRGLPLSEAAQLYGLLTIGDGLVSQVPALFVSVAASLVVTRVDGPARRELARELAAQLLSPHALLGSALLLGLLAAVPGLPKLAFGLVSVVTAGSGLYRHRRDRDRAAPSGNGDVVQQGGAIEVLVGANWARHAARLKPRLEAVVGALSEDFGFILPRLMVSSEATLPEAGFEIRLRGVPYDVGLLPAGRLLCDVAPARLPAESGAEPARHPTTGTLASWVPADAAPRLRSAGMLLYDEAAVLALRLEGSLRNAAYELVGLEETQRLLDQASKENPALVRAAVPHRIQVSTLAEVLRRLLHEGLSIGNLRDVLETIVREKTEVTEPTLLVERIRVQQRRLISYRHARHRRLGALVLDADAEEAVRGALKRGATGPVLSMEPDLAEAFLGGLERELEGQTNAVILTSSELRRHVRRLIEVDHPRLPVLAYDELLGDVEIERLGTIRLA